jgi:hypothetical protein
MTPKSAEVLWSTERKTGRVASHEYVRVALGRSRNVVMQGLTLIDKTFCLYWPGKAQPVVDGFHGIGWRR